MLSLKRYYTTWVEIDSFAFNNNIKELRKLIGQKVELMAVIKSNAYGHGFLEIAELCEKNSGVNGLCVVSLEEALILRSKKITKPIFVLAIYDLDKKKLAKGIKNNIVFPIYTLEQARILNSVGEMLRKKAIVHLKIDIGTCRIGILKNELSVFIKKIKDLKNLRIDGVFGHFASSENDVKRTNNQDLIFKDALSIITKNGLNTILRRHTACSAATILHPKTHYTATRVGLAIYGLDPSPQTKLKIRLKPILSWYTKILQVKTIPKGSRISYGGTFVAKQKTKLAILPVGYWDGYDRKLSNCGRVIINGKLCPIRGRVCMNLVMVDVTNVKKVSAGDKAILLGRINKNTQISAEFIAKKTNTISYEVVTRINPLIPRILV